MKRITHQALVFSPLVPCSFYLFSCSLLYLSSLHLFSFSLLFLSSPSLFSFSLLYLSSLSLFSKPAVNSIITHQALIFAPFIPSRRLLFLSPLYSVFSSVLQLFETCPSPPPFRPPSFPWQFDFSDEEVLAYYISLLKAWGVASPSFDPRLERFAS